MSNKIKSEIEKILKQAGVTGKIKLSAPPNPEMGDLSFACFDLAKKTGKSPAEIAKDLETSFRHHDVITPRCRVEAKKSDKINRLLEKATTIGPYLNFFLNASVLAEEILPTVLKKKNKYGESPPRPKEKILIEYPSNNTHKEVHVGHLRIACVGNALVKLFEATGAKVLPVNYINDFGVHVAKCLWGLRKFHSKEKPPQNKQRWLGKIYTEASRYLEEHLENKEEVKEILRLLERHDKKIWKIFCQTRGWSLKGFDAIFKELGVKHKVAFFEKDVKDLGQKMIDELLKRKIAEVGEGGAIIVDLKKYGLDVALVRKSNGSGLYLTSDLGLAKVKAKKFPNVTASINLTGAEQSFYFKQLFKILELSGFKYQMSHVACELVDLPEGKMSSRAGRVILYEVLRDEAIKNATEETQKRHLDWPRKKIAATAKALALGALKFSMVKVGPGQGITFNIKEAVSFDGFTGPYLQYSVARIESIFKKANQSKPNKCETGKCHAGKSKSDQFMAGQLWAGKIDFSLLNAPEEKNLILTISRLEEIIASAALNKDPSVLAKYLYDLAQIFSNFYENCPVLQAENVGLKAARLALAKAVKIVLEKGLGILGVPILKEM